MPIHRAISVHNQLVQATRATKMFAGAHFVGCSPPRTVTTNRFQFVTWAHGAGGSRRDIFCYTCGMVHGCGISAVMVEPCDQRWGPCQALPFDRGCLMRDIAIVGGG